MLILDADKEGFLRSETSLIQTAGRAARHVNGEVVLFADDVTDSIQKLLDISSYRREKQVEHNEAHGITPQSVKRAVQETLRVTVDGREVNSSVVKESGTDFDVLEVLRELEEEMQEAAVALEFERAALLRDQIGELKKRAGIEDSTSRPQIKTKKKPKRKKVKY